MQRRLGQQGAGCSTGRAVSLVTALFLSFAATMATAQQPSAADMAKAAAVRQRLSQMVNHATTIFSGGVYAIRTLESGEAKGTVLVEFVVGQGVRNADVGGRVVLKLRPELWSQYQSVFAVHDRMVVFLLPPDADGYSTPVEGPAGIFPVVSNSTVVDLTRLQALVNGGAAAAGSSTKVSASANGNAGNQQNSQNQLSLDVASNGMPELADPEVPFLAFLRDIYVLCSPIVDSSAPLPSASPK